MKPVLGVSLSVLLLGLQGLLGAGTPGNSSTDAVTEGFGPSAATDELNHAEQNRSSALPSSESLSPSQRNILLSLPAEAHTAAAAALGKVPLPRPSGASTTIGQESGAYKEKPKQKAGWNYGQVH